MASTLDASFWDDIYRARDAEWDDEPNPVLATEAAGLAPGTALDAGCGEGSDAVWLARRGWHVTAVDISAVALDRARDADTTGRVSWLQADLLEWQPPTSAYDLVTAQFIHFPGPARERFFRRLAQAVRPGGTLLVVAHHPSDLDTTAGRWPISELFYTAEEVASVLAPEDWEVVENAARPRTFTDPQGRTITVHDTVLLARRGHRVAAT